MYPCVDGCGYDEHTYKVSCMIHDNIVLEWPKRGGLEHVQLWSVAGDVKADGLIIVDADDGVIRVRYSIYFQPGWRLKRCNIIVPVGATQKVMCLSLDPEGSWAVNGEPLAKVRTFDTMFRRVSSSARAPTEPHSRSRRSSRLSATIDLGG
jgi:Putative glycolipid-binding